MLSVLMWILVGIGILCIIVFPGKRKSSLPSSDRETMISDAACNIAVTAFILSQMLFPIYGYYIFTVNYPHSDSNWDGYGAELKRVITSININSLEPFDNKPQPSVYAFVMLAAVFCFFAGMSIYKNGIKIKHKIFLLIPLLTMIVAAVRFLLGHEASKRKIGYFLMYESLVQIDVFIRYLCGAVFMITVLYGIYLLLKKILHNELIPLILILIVSFFAPDIRVIRDGLNVAHDGMLRIMTFGPDIPLFPLGMIVMKYKDKLLPKTKKGILIHIASWFCAGGISFYALSGLQFFLIRQAGLKPSDALTDVWYDGLGGKLLKLEKIYRLNCIPWLIFGLALSMLLIGISLLIRTGNPVTKFLREHCCLITVLLFSRHVFFETSLWEKALWTDVFKIPENMFIIVPFIYFVLSVVLAFLIKRLILSRKARRTTRLRGLQGQRQ